MNSVLVTWNPGPCDEDQYTPEQWDDLMVKPYLRGETVDESWSVGRRVKNIEPGDVAYMYRQGECGRGIVARGIIRSGPTTGQHFLYDNETCNYVDIEWQEAVPTDLAIDVDQLETLAPHFEWRKVYGSGRILPADTTDALAEAWDRYVHAESTQVTSELYTSDLWRRFVAVEGAPELVLGESSMA
jgi:hypothetical protein